jgi:hypothetical protein
MADLAEVITRFSKSYIEKYKPPPRVRGILALIGCCRTAAMGARMYRCENCGHELPVYNSCGNRHCPRCLGARRAQWVEQREQELLRLPYFHTVFTLPHELHGLIRANRRELYDLLFAAASETLRKFGADPRHALEGQLGFVTVLHTWDRKLGFHPHLHVLIAAGALSADRARFQVLRGGRWLFPVEALSPVFRGIYLEKLKALRKTGKIEFEGSAAGISTAAGFGSLLDLLYEKNWVVYAKAPFGGPRRLVRYLARYIHRVGICDQRILEVSESSVCFSYRERDDEQTLRTMNLQGADFLGRFAQHILPKGFTRIRFYGFWSNSLKGKLLPLIRRMLGSETCSDADERKSNECFMQTEAFQHTCPQCGNGPILPCQRLLPSTGPPLQP